jgi:hypothetical protein
MPHIDLDIYTRAAGVDYEFIDERRAASSV